MFEDPDDIVDNEGEEALACPDEIMLGVPPPPPPGGAALLAVSATTVPPAALICSKVVPSGRLGTTWVLGSV